MQELEGRIAAAPLTPPTQALADVLTTPGRLTNDLEAAANRVVVPGRSLR